MSIAAVRGIGVAVITSTSGDCPPFAAQEVALLHAEAVLLVDHRHAEAGELDAAVDQRVGADEDVDLAGAQAVGDPAPLGRGRAVGEQRRRAPGARRAACPPTGTVSPSSSARIVSSCCSASTSVGAMNAPW